MRPDPLFSPSIIVVLLSLVTRIFATEPDYHLRLESQSVDIRAANGQTITVVTAKLFYKNNSGISAPSNESYILSVIDGKYPKIIDAVEGHSVTFQLVDLDEVKGPELLVYYFSGGNQYAVKLYGVQGIDITPLETQPGSSNMRSIKIDGKKIIVENEERISESEAFILIDSYAVLGGKCKLLGEQKRVVRKKVSTNSSRDAGYDNK